MSMETRREEIDTNDLDFHADNPQTVIASTEDASFSSLDKQIRGGTVMNTSFNTLTNIVGGSILSLPLAMHHGSVIVSVILLILSIYFAWFAVLALTYGAEVLQKFSYTELLAFALFPDVPVDAAGTNGSDDSKGNMAVFDSNQTELAATEPHNDIMKSKSHLHRAITLEDLTYYDPKTYTRNHKMRRWITMGMELVVFFNNYGSLIMYPRIMSDAMPSVLSNFLHASGIWVTKWFWLLIPSIVFFILSCARNLHELKFTSLAGFLCMFYFVIVILIRYFQNLTTPISTAPGMGEITWFKLSVSLFSTISTYALAICYHYNVPYYYRELKVREPKMMMRTVVAALPTIFITYGTTGLLGYLTFGAAVAGKKAGGNIVNNYPSNDLLVNIGRLGLFFHFAFVYPMHSICARRELHRFFCFLIQKPVDMSNVNNIIEVNARPPGDPATTRRIAIIAESFLIVLSATVIGALVPGINVVIEITGCLFGVPLMFTLPGLIGLAVFKPGVQACKSLNIRLCRVASWISVVIGIIFVVCGVVAFIIEQVNKHN